MKKKFASFLVTGKAATLPFFVNNSLADTSAIDILFDSQPRLIERTGQGIDVDSLTDDTVKIVSPGAGCSFPQPSDTMNVVITGIHEGDVVYLASADSKDYPEYLAVDPDFRIGNQNLRILSNFLVNKIAGAPLSGFQNGGGDLENTTSVISMPVDLSQISAKNNGVFYLQAVIVRTNPVEGLPSGMVFSELDEITQVTATCDSYGIHY